ncbi:hypothetical protein ACLMJK_007937 [Lecanora helva]
MASIFTFEAEPSRVSSPWPTTPSPVIIEKSSDKKPTLAGLGLPRAEVLNQKTIGKLEAEPQDGPIEYKLHLLLRQRRNYSFTSTVQNVSGSHLTHSHTPRANSEPNIKQMSTTPASAPSSQSRQNRLQHLTTQLLWRLQQSYPYHSTAKSNLVLPMLPEVDIERSPLSGPRPLIPGLEGSSGALYEIGVSDDGTFVGITKDELEESLTVLRAMAFSLGCDIQILRMIIVGDCQWNEMIRTEAKLISRLRSEKLWVAEVLVAPCLEHENTTPGPSNESEYTEGANDANPEIGTYRRKIFQLGKEQLRVSLTGSTTSGKSSLLGTLSTSTLDNGRGKSRLSLFKHRHEIVSGVTSSLAQELFGYQPAALEAGEPYIKVINYASGNVSSWEDIHNASESARMVFVTDSAGHPRYKRTTIRGLVSWAPDWTLCCIAADDQEDKSGKVGATASATEILGSTGVGTDLSKAHLNLCLKLDLPLIIVITKLDLATKIGLRDTLAKILTLLKSAGRKPTVISSPTNSQTTPNLQQISENDAKAAKSAIDSVDSSELHLLVPIILTSSVTGNGIGKLHSFLQQLPIATNRATTSPMMHPQDDIPPHKLFHIDEVFGLAPSQHGLKWKTNTPSTILSGYLKYGSIHVGDVMLIGPCLSDGCASTQHHRNLHRAKSYPGLLKASAGNAAPALDTQRSASGEPSSMSKGLGECTNLVDTWQEVRVLSLRNLRLPVRTLTAGHVGTIGVMPHSRSEGSAINKSTLAPYVRRGMVLLPMPHVDCNDPLPSYTRFSAIFQEASLPAWPGVLVTIYTASIRASAKILEVKALEPDPAADEVFHFDNDASSDSSNTTHDVSLDNQHTEITFQFATTQEWLEVGTQALVAPGGGPSLTGQPEQREVGGAGLDGMRDGASHAPQLASRTNSNNVNSAEISRSSIHSEKLAEEEAAISIERAAATPSVSSPNATAYTKAPNGSTPPFLRTSCSQGDVHGFTTFGEDNQDSKREGDEHRHDKEFEVQFDQDNDPMNPRCMSNRRKWMIVFIVSAGSTCVTCTSSMYTSTYAQFTNEFHVSRVVATLGLSLFVMGLGISPMFLGPLSEFYGRRPIYIVSFTFFLIWLIPCAVAQNIATELVARFVDGMAGSAFLSVAGGTVGDMFARDKLQAPMMIFTASPFIGPPIGPIIAGFINQYTNWRWTFYVLIIWSVVILGLIAVLVPETYHPVVLRHKAIKLRKQTGDERYKAPIEIMQRSIMQTVLRSCYRPFLLLTLEPMCLNLCLFSALLLGILYLFFGAFEIVFADNHHFELWQISLTFSGLLVGQLIAIATDSLWRKNYVRLIRNREKHGGEPGGSEPEYRLPPAIAGAVLVPIGLFWYDYIQIAGSLSRLMLFVDATVGSRGPYYRRYIGSTVPIIGSGDTPDESLSTRMLLVFSGIFTFLVDAYPLYAASALAANRYVPVGSSFLIEPRNSDAGDAV